MRIDLDDGEDVRAFQVYASREPLVTVFVDFDEAAINTAPVPAPDADATSTTPKSVRRSRPKSAAAHAAQADSTASNTPAADTSERALSSVPPSETNEANDAAEVFARLTELEPPSAPAAKAKAAPKKRKTPALAETPTQTETPSSEPPPPSQALPDRVSQDEDEDDDIPLSQGAPLSSQSAPAPSQDAEKPKRHRRTKAEMEAFRAEQAAKKAEKEQARQQAASREAADESTADAADATVDAGDETTIVHDVRGDEPTSAAAAAVQVLMAEGSDAMHRRLTDLKAKKQRKNGAEREEQRLLVNLIGKEAAPEADTTTRE